jgi:hypothetical protein
MHALLSVYVRPYGQSEKELLEGVRSAAAL